jgi:cytochrome c oxidase subunit 4
VAERIISTRTYYAVFGSLIALTILTLGLSFLQLGNWHTPIGLTIAVGKTLLVALFFMHLLYSPRLSGLVFAGALFWLGILLVLTLSDYLTRHWLAY